jgi:AcrR family transcriptional regulator
VQCSGEACEACGRLGDALTAVIGEGLYLATSERELCERAGVPAEDFGAHARSMEACMVSAFERGMDRLYACAAAAFARPGAWEARLRDAMRAVVEELSSQPGLARLCYVDALELGGIEVWRRRERARERFVALLSREDDGALPSLRFELIVGALHMALRRHAIEQGDWSDVAGLADALVEQALVFEPLAA